MTQHEASMRQAIDLARKAMARGDHPFGALLVVDGEVALSAMNSVHTDDKVTRHAEMNLVEAALEKLDEPARGRAILYTSTEPCPMCAGAIYWAGIRAVVFGCPGAVLAKIAGGEMSVPCAEIFARGLQETDVTGPVLGDEARALHEAFWPDYLANKS